MSKGRTIWTDAQVETIQRRLGHIPDKPLAKPAKPAKYRNRKVIQGDQVFDSAKEARRWAVLEQMQSAGQIQELRRQVAFELAPAVKLMGENRTKPALRYVSDFTYLRDGKRTIEDIKSPATRKLAIYRAKAHLMKTVLGLDIHEV